MIKYNFYKVFQEYNNVDNLCDCHEDARFGLRESDDDVDGSDNEEGEEEHNEFLQYFN